MSLNRARLERVSGVNLTDLQFAELVDIITLYKQSAAGLPLFMADHFLAVNLQGQVAERLRAVTEFVWLIWRDAGGTGYGARWDKDSLIQGRFVGLMQELFHTAGLKEPHARTLRRYLKSFSNEGGSAFRELKSN